MTTATAPITLTKDDEPAELDGCTEFHVGASWDASSGSSGRFMGALRKKKGTDLDCLAIAMQGDDPVRLAGLDSLDPFQNGSLTHSGDNFTGHGEGDDETITVKFASIPRNVTSIVFVCAAFKKGSALGDARNVAFNLYDASDGRPEKVADIWPSLLARGNAVAVAKAFRVGDVWRLQVLNNPGNVTQGDERSLMRFAIGQ